MSHAVQMGAAGEVVGRTLAAHEKVRAHFSGLEDAPVGFAYAVGEEVFGLRAFAHPDLLARRFEGFLKTICLKPGWRGTESRRPGRWRMPGTRQRS